MPWYSALDALRRNWRIFWGAGRDRLELLGLPDVLMVLLDLLDELLDLLDVLLDLLDVLDVVEVVAAGARGRSSCRSSG